MKRLALAFAWTTFFALCGWSLGSMSVAQEWSGGSDMLPGAVPLGQSGYIVPGSPQAPMTGSRPAAWPAGPTRLPDPAEGPHYMVDPAVIPSAYGEPQMAGDAHAAAVSAPVYPQTPYPAAPIAAVASAAPAPPATPPYAAGAIAPPTQPNPPGMAGGDPWNTAAQSQYPLGTLEPCAGARILARIGSEIVLAGELLAGVNDVLERNKDRIPPEQLDIQRELLLRSWLTSYLETKLVYLDAKNTIPEENMPGVEKELTGFWEKHELPAMIERAGVADRTALEAKLTAMGTSLEREKQRFSEKAIAAEWLKQNVKPTGEVSRAQMLQYYHEHIADFTHEGKVRWEQISVNFDSYPSKQQAYQAIAALGNLVLRGSPLADVARQHSEAVSAAEGGMNDWTTQGSLVDEELDRALFGLPVGKLSPIIEGHKAFHIVRVVERVEAGRTPFEETQKDIVAKIREERKEQATKDYVEGLRRRYPVWTIYDGQPMPPLVGEQP